MISFQSFLSCDHDFCSGGEKNFCSDNLFIWSSLIFYISENIWWERKKSVMYETDKNKKYI